MLKTITKQFRDRSTERFFQFSFYCDRCGREWTSEQYPFVHGFPEELSEDERRAKEILWRIDHDAAFERANLEARLRFNSCKACGKIVCDGCFAVWEEEDLCVDCAAQARGAGETPLKGGIAMKYF